MNKLFGLFLLALACWVPSAAYAVNCFWVGGTGTWDANNTGGGGAGGIKWASASGGGTTCAGGGTGGSPSTADDATFDASSGGGTVTVNATISINNMTMSAFTGTVDFAANDNNITIANNFTNTGSGTRTLNMGDGTWTMSSNAAFFTQTGATNLTFNANGSTLAFTGTGGTFGRRFFLGTGRVYNIVTVASGTAPFIMGTTTGTIGTFTVSPGNYIQLPDFASTLTITTFTNITGSSSLQTLFSAPVPSNGRGIISSANNWTCTWCGFAAVTFSGGGTFSATNSFDFLGNSGITITAPSGGGGGGGRIIGG